MATSGGAYGASRAQDTDFRKKWDKEEYAEKAKKKDQEERERMQENDERMKQGALHAVLVIADSSYCVGQERNLERDARMTCRKPLN